MKHIFSLIFLFSFACSKQTFVVENGYGSYPDQEGTSHFFVLGVGQENVVDASEICPDGIGKVTAYQSPKDIAVVLGISLITGGFGGWIYTPLSYEVYCLDK